MGNYLSKISIPCNPCRSGADGLTPPSSPSSPQRSWDSATPLASNSARSSRSASPEGSRRQRTASVSSSCSAADSQLEHLSIASSTGVEREFLVPGRESRLVKRTDANQRQYLLDGHALFGQYRTKTKAQHRLDKECVGGGCQSVVYKRKNPHSPALLKVSTSSAFDERDSRRLDRIALLLATTPERDMAAHFAIEVHKGFDDEGNYLFLTRKVEGMTLQAYFGQSAYASRFPVDRLPPMLDELDAAVAWLNRHGFVHRDIKPDNVMIDLDARKLVLIDFGISREHSSRVPTDESARLREYVEDQLQSLGSAYRDAWAARGPVEAPQSQCEEVGDAELFQTASHDGALESEPEFDEAEVFFRDDSSLDDLRIGKNRG
jgi:hypothetical protein